MTPSRGCSRQDSDLTQSSALSIQDEWVLSLLYLQFAILPPSAALAEAADGAVYGV